MNVQINKIGVLIRDERLRCKMTQEELGAKVGVGKAQISKIESGKGLTIKTVNKVLEALDLSATVRLIGAKNIGNLQIILIYLKCLLTTVTTIIQM